MSMRPHLIALAGIGLLCCGARAQTEARAVVDATVSAEVDDDGAVLFHVTCLDADLLTAWIGSDEADVEAALIDGTGSVLARDDDGGPLLDARLELSCTTSSELSILAQMKQPRQGRISLRLERGRVPLPEGTALIVLEALRSAAIGEAMVRDGKPGDALPKLANAGLDLFNAADQAHAGPILIRAMDIGRDLGAVDLERQLAVLAGFCCASLGTLDLAERCLERGAALTGPTGPPTLQLLGHQARALIADQRGLTGEAEAQFAAALDLAPRSQRSVLLVARARLLRLGGDTSGALALLDEALSTATDLGDARGVADAQLGRAVLARHARDDAAAADALARAFDASDDPLLRARVTAERGALAADRGEYSRARTAMLEAADAFLALSRSDLHAQALYQLALTAVQQGRVDEADVLLERALGELPAGLAPQLEARLRILSTQVALEHVDIGQSGECDAVGVTSPEVGAALSRAKDLLDQVRAGTPEGGDPRLAIYLELAAAEVARESLDEQAVGEALAAAERLAERSGDARSKALVAVRAVEHARGTGVSPDVLREQAAEARALSLAHGNWPEAYQGLAVEAETLVALGDGLAALDAVHATQALIERPDFSLATDLEVMGFRSRPHYEDLARIGQQAVVLALEHADTEQRAALIEEGTRLAAYWKAWVLLDELADRGDVHADPLEALAVGLSPGDVLIEYVEGKHDLFAYVHGDGPARLHDLGSRCEIADMARAYRDRVADPLGRYGPASIAELGVPLHDRLLGVVPPGEGTLVVVPCASLSALPFEALVSEAPERPRSFDELRFVLDERPVVYAPSIPVLGTLSTRAVTRRGDERVLVLADPSQASDEYPRLPGARAEALAILAASGHAVDALQHDDVVGDEVRVLAGAAATPAALSAALPGRTILHIGAHGVIDPSDPRGSALLLAPDGPDDDGRLTTSDVMALDLHTDLVVLAACDTGRGQVLRGEGVQSLARAFLAAGSRTVIVTLWPVRDAAAGATMARLYDELLERDGSLVEAARAARLAVRRGESVSASGRRSSPRGGVHPHDWAAFVLVGPTH